MKNVWIGIGSNVDAEANMQRAAGLLRGNFPGIVFSHVYETAPMLDIEQDGFLNAAGHFETDLSPEEVQTVLQSIEATLKKNPPHRYGPRTIDLDILLIETEIIDTPTLKVPHPRIRERRFVLEPLLELIDPSAVLPGSTETYAALHEAVLDQECSPIDLAL